MDEANKTLSRNTAVPHDRKRSAIPLFRSEDLLKGGKMIVIEHSGRKYQLRVTSGNKLILTA